MKDHRKSENKQLEEYKHINVNKKNNHLDVMVGNHPLSGLNKNVYLNSH